MARILVIEDNPANLELMRYLLAAFGHTVIGAGDGVAGVRSALHERPDLIVCDLLLPLMDGYAIVRALRAEPAWRVVPVVAVTALAGDADRDRVAAGGFDGYLTKPIDPETFVVQVDRFLRADQRGSAPAASAAASAPAASGARVATRATVLVVDDSATNRELIYQTLAPFGLEVRLASNVAGAIEQLAIALPDLILSDLHMPGEDGFAFIRRIKADPRLSGVPFLFISSSVWGEDDRATALQLGVTRFLLRPLDPQRLVDEVGLCMGLQLRSADGDDPGR